MATLPDRFVSNRPDFCDWNCHFMDTSLLDIDPVIVMGKHFTPALLVLAQILPLPVICAPACFRSMNASKV